MMWAKEERPKKIATVKPTGVSNKVTGGAKVDPGGPDIQVALIGSEKSLLKAKTITICTACKIAAQIFTFRNDEAVIGLLIVKKHTCGAFKKWLGDKVAKSCFLQLF